MRLTEIVSFLELSIYPSIALIFFLAAFIGILWTVLRRPRAETDLDARIPLDDDVVCQPRIPSLKANQTDEGVSHG